MQTTTTGMCVIAQPNMRSRQSEFRICCKMYKCVPGLRSYKVTNTAQQVYFQVTVHTEPVLWRYMISFCCKKLFI